MFKSLFKKKQQSGAVPGTSSLFSFGMRGKIFGAMGSLCILLGFIAGTSLNIISDNLSVSSSLVSSSNKLSKRVKEVSDSIQETLEKQQMQQKQFAETQDALTQEMLSRQVKLYQSILAVEQSMTAVDRNSNLIINDAEPYSVVANEVETLRKELQEFFALPEMGLVDPKKVKGANRAGRGYLQTYDEVKALDEENVSMSQQVELVEGAKGIGESLRGRMLAVVEAIKKVAKEQLDEQRVDSREKMRRAQAEDKKTLGLILASQKEIRETVQGNVTEISALETFLIAKRASLLVIATVALILGVIFSFAIVRLISRPIIRAAEIAKGIVDGDLDQVVDISGQDEIGQLGNSMATMIDKLRTNHLEVEESVLNLDQVACTVSASLEEISAAMEEIQGMTQYNVEKARIAEGMSTETKTSAEQGLTRVEEMVSSMTQVNKASQEIAKTVKVINDIAFQTNLLALNAAVEAAHAGEQGAGFAVVAEEVRSLAGRCAAAANDTTELIDGPLKRIGYATDVANKMEEDLRNIHGKIEGMNSLIKEISTASEEQATGIKQTNSGLNQIDVAAQSLASQTDQLTNTMERFRKQPEPEYGDEGDIEYLPES